VGQAHVDKESLVGVRIDDLGLLEAAQVGQALDLARTEAGLAERRDQEGNEQSDDGDDHQQLDEREGAWAHMRALGRACVRAWA